jgi:FAD/FMN-containing dehydrogenase
VQLRLPEWRENMCSVLCAFVVLLLAWRVGEHQSWVYRPGLPPSNWDGTVLFQPQEQRFAKSVSEVQALVGEALSRSVGVKAVGAGHSWNAIADPSGAIALNIDALDSFQVLRENPDEGTATVRVGGGLRLYKLIELLWERGYSFHNLPSVNSQSVGGLIATACHGSGVGTPGFTDSVMGVGLVTALNASAPLVELSREDLDRWRDVRPGARLWTVASPEEDAALQRRARWFDAARAHLGVLGVVVWVDLHVVPAFHLVAEEFLVRTDDVFVAADTIPPPAGAISGTWASAAAFFEECGHWQQGKPVNAECASRTIDWGLDQPPTSLRWLSSRFEFLKLWVLPHTEFTVVHGIRRATREEETRETSSMWTTLLDEVSTDGLDLLMAVGARFPSWQPTLNWVAAQTFKTPRVRRAPAHRLHVIPFRVPFHSETEWSVPVSHASRLFRKMQAAMVAKGVATGFVQEWRMVAPDSVMVSPDQETPGEALEPRIHVTLGLRRPDWYGLSDTYFGSMEAEAAALSGRFHWAKRFGVTPVSQGKAAISELLPAGQWEAFCETVQELDPHGVFQNEWARQILQ